MSVGTDLFVRTNRYSKSLLIGRRISRGHCRLVATWCLLFTLALCCIKSVATAQQNYFIQHDVELLRLGAQGNYFYVQPAQLSFSCSNGVVYIAAERKGQYAMLLMAKGSNQKLSRLDFRIEGSQCWVELVEINN